jgi:hypothetical protein
MSELTIIEKALKYLNAVNEETRKNDIEDRLDYYYDNFKDLIDDELEDQFQEDNYDNIKIMIDDSINLVEYITNETAILYVKEPQRKLSKNSKRWDEIQKTIMQDIIMDKANKLTYVCNECGIIIQPRNGTIELDIVSPNMISVIQKEEDPTQIFGFIYEINLSNTIDNDLTDQVAYKRDLYKREFIYYDIEGNHLKFDQNNKIITNEKNPDNVNPYKDKKGKFILPLIICHKKYNENSVWDETSGNKLFSATKQIAVIASLFNYYMKNSSHKQPVVTGQADVQIPDKQVLDVLKVLKVIGEGAKIELLDFQGNLEQFFQQIQHKIELTLNQEGLALDDFTKSGSPESGYKLQLKKEPLKKKINEQKPFFRIYENDLFDKIRIVNNTMYNEKIDENIEFTIDFAEIEFEKDPEEVRKQRSFDLHNNLTNPLKLMMEDNPDIETEKDAEKIYNENKEINDRLNVNLEVVNNNLNNKFNKFNKFGGGKNAMQKEKEKKKKEIIK